MAMVGTNDTLGVRAIAKGSTATLLVFVLSLLVFGLTASPEVNPYDEGLILTGAMQTAAGAVPHRDFYIVYGPGQFYTVAALFDLFGQNVWIERLYDFAVKAGVVCFVYAFSSRLMRTPYVYLVTALCVLWIAVARSPAYPIWPTLLLILASFWLAHPIFYGDYSRARLAGAGLCAGTAVVFRYDMGLLSLTLISAALIVYASTDRRSSRSRLTRIFLTMAPFWGASGAVLVLLAVAYVKYGIVDDFVFQILAYPSANYVEARRLPFPAPSRDLMQNMSSVVYMPPVVILAFLILTVQRYLHRRFVLTETDTAELYLSCLIASLAFGLYFKGLVRVSIPHMISSIVPSVIILGQVIDRFLSRQSWSARAVGCAPVIAALILTIVPSLPAARLVQWYARINLADAVKAARSRISKDHATGGGDERCDRRNNLERARCLRMSASRLRAIRFVINNTTPDQPIIVLNGTNDKTVANDASLYFLAGRLPATKWGEFDPGLQSSEEIQSKMVGELEAIKPPLVIQDSEWDDVNEPNGSARHSGVTLLDDYIHQHYKQVAEFEPYVILQR